MGLVRQQQRPRHDRPLVVRRCVQAAHEAEEIFRIFADVLRHDRGSLAHWPAYVYALPELLACFDNWTGT